MYFVLFTMILFRHFRKSWKWTQMKMRIVMKMMMTTMMMMMTSENSCLFSVNLRSVERRGSFIIIFFCLTNVFIFLFLFSDDDKKVKAVEKSPIKTPQKVSLAVSVHVHNKKRGKAVYYTAAQKFGVELICNALERSFLCSPKLHLFNQKYSKTVIL